MWVSWRPYGNIWKMQKTIHCRRRVSARMVGNFWPEYFLANRRNQYEWWPARVYNSPQRFWKSQLVRVKCACWRPRTFLYIFCAHKNTFTWKRAISILSGASKNLHCIVEQLQVHKNDNADLHKTEIRRILIPFLAPYPKHRYRVWIWIRCSYRLLKYLQHSSFLEYPIQDTPAFCENVSILLEWIENDVGHQDRLVWRSGCLIVQGYHAWRITV